MITDTGKNLSVLIVTETGKDWETFSTWYSFQHNLPDSEVSVVVFRNQSMPFMCYQWAKRLQIRSMHLNRRYNHEFADQLDAVDKAKRSNMISHDHVLVVKPLTVALDLFDEPSLEILKHESGHYDQTAWHLHKPDINNLLNEVLLEDKTFPLAEPRFCPEAKETESLRSLVTYGKGCGRWINTSKGCPFSCAAGLVTPEMTANEHKIIELWKKMVPLYDATM